MGSNSIAKRGEKFKCFSSLGLRGLEKTSLLNPKHLIHHSVNLEEGSFLDDLGPGFCGQDHFLLFSVTDFFKVNTPRTPRPSLFDQDIPRARISNRWIK